METNWRAIARHRYPSMIFVGGDGGQGRGVGGSGNGWQRVAVRSASGREAAQMLLDTWKKTRRSPARP